eukprot:jgi/Mesvir1/6091/Mv00807-RA.1
MILFLGHDPGSINHITPIYRQGLEFFQASTCILSPLQRNEDAAQLLHLECLRKPGKTWGGIDDARSVLDNYLKQCKVELCVCGLSTNSAEVDVAEACKERGILCVMVIDFDPGHRLHGLRDPQEGPGRTPQHFIVTNAQAGKQLEEKFGVPHDCITVGGSCHLEALAVDKGPAALSPSEVASKLGLPSAQRMLAFFLAPDDMVPDASTAIPASTRSLLSALAGTPWQVIVRPHPRNHPETVAAIRDLVAASSTSSPSASPAADVAAPGSASSPRDAPHSLAIMDTSGAVDNKSLIKACAVTLSMGSTVSVESIVMGTPSVFYEVDWDPARIEAIMHSLPAPRVHTLQQLTSFLDSWEQSAAAEVNPENCMAKLLLVPVEPLQEIHMRDEERSSDCVDLRVKQLHEDMVGRRNRAVWQDLHGRFQPKHFPADCRYVRKELYLLPPAILLTCCTVVTGWSRLAAGSPTGHGPAHLKVGCRDCRLPTGERPHEHARSSEQRRPLDITKKLEIVRSVTELDNDEAGVSRTVHHAHVALDADNEEVLTTADHEGKDAIPIPECHIVESYEQDYPKDFKHPDSYLRFSRVRTDNAEYIEYDLDEVDEDWLAHFNADRKQLPPERLEVMIWKLELLAQRMLEKQLLQREKDALLAGIPSSGGLAKDQITFPLPTKEAALEMLQSLRGGTGQPAVRHSVLSAVYDYWIERRNKAGKPLLRRLQPPPAVTDPNPFNVFRPREKVQRPHTRRMQRRENDLASFQKLSQARENADYARQILQQLQKRELKKKEILNCEFELQALQIAKRHDPPSVVATLEAAVEAEERARRVRLQLSRQTELAARNQRIAAAAANGGVDPGLLRPGADAGGADALGYNQKLKRQKRKRQRTVGVDGRLIGVGPQPLEPSLLFTLPMDEGRLGALGITTGLHAAFINLGPPVEKQVRTGPPEPATSSGADLGPTSSLERDGRGMSGLERADVAPPPPMEASTPAVLATVPPMTPSLIISRGDGPDLIQAERATAELSGVHISCSEGNYGGVGAHGGAGLFYGDDGPGFDINNGPAGMVIRKGARWCVPS